MKNNGLKDDELKVSDPALMDIVRYYTREAGVRNLEREVAKIGRKAVKQLLLEKKDQKQIAITPRNLDKYLGVKRFRYGKAEDQNRVGQVTGLAWTEVGGELLTIEAAVVPGKGKLQHTGQLGEVMQESIQAAMTVVRSRAQVLGLEPEFYQKQDVHLHIPEGATPKDGPSAGIGMCTALVSALTKIPVRSDVAMTGEITLRGEVLPIGGLKEKLLAAHRGGIKTVLIPHENTKDLVEIPDNIKGNLEIKPVKWIEEVLGIALTQQPAVAGGWGCYCCGCGRCRERSSCARHAVGMGSGGGSSRLRRTEVVTATGVVWGDSLDYAAFPGGGVSGAPAVPFSRMRA